MVSDAGSDTRTGFFGPACCLPHTATTSSRPTSSSEHGACGATQVWRALLCASCRPGQQAPLRCVLWQVWWRPRRDLRTLTCACSGPGKAVVLRRVLGRDSGRHGPTRRPLRPARGAVQNTASARASIARAARSDMHIAAAACHQRLELNEQSGRLFVPLKMWLVFGRGVKWDK